MLLFRGVALRLFAGGFFLHLFVGLGQLLLDFQPTAIFLALLRRLHLRVFRSPRVIDDFGSRFRFLAETGLRPVDVVQAKGLILIIFEDEDEAGGDVYLYAEPLAGYADLQMEDRQVASLIVVHLEELLGGVGWQQHVPALRLGRLVLLKPSTLTSTA